MITVWTHMFYVTCRTHIEIEPKLLQNPFCYQVSLFTCDTYAAEYMYKF